MTVEVVSVLCGGPGVRDDMGPIRLSNAYDNRENRVSPCAAYQRLLEESRADILVLIHDDVTIHDPDWLARVLQLFERAETVAVGLGGARALGNRDLYRKPFNIWNLARRGYASNQTDAETHGARISGTRRVAVLDAFVMAIRTDFLRARSGWPVDHLTHHCLDLWLACEAARAMKEIWMVGVSCTHHGGGSSTAPAYAKAGWLQGQSMESDHILPHRWLWTEYRDVLPVEIS